MLAIHVGFLIFERLSAWRLLLSILALVGQYRLITDMPRIEFLPAAANVVLVVINHILWHSFFTVSRYALIQVFMFFVFMVWAIPLAILVVFTSGEFLPRHQGY